MADRALKPALQTSRGRVGPWGGSRLINAFAEQSMGDKAELYAVMAIPGLTPWVTLGSLPVRGVHQMVGTVYAVAGTTLYSIAATGVATSLAMVPGTLPVRFADNGTQIAIHDGGITGYVWNGSTLATPLNLPSVSDVT